MARAARPKKKSEPMRLGNKRCCPDCGRKFYDFNRASLPCPGCGEVLDFALAEEQPKEKPEESDVTLCARPKPAVKPIEKPSQDEENEILLQSDDDEFESFEEFADASDNDDEQAIEIEVVEEVEEEEEY